MRRTLTLLIAAVFCVTAHAADAQTKKKGKKKQQATESDNSAAPDKILYDRAINDIKRGRQEVGRLTLQTLINTYPDSEYLAKAKLAIADSFYKEGGTASLTQAIATYKDFIVFFPFLPEAAYAQMQVGMAHYKQLQKPDRDRTEARVAEDEFQTFLQKYPNDPLVPQAQQRLREVQEILAEGDYRIGYYYYVKGSYRASAGRLLTIAKRYPLYSKSDHALWMLGNIFEKGENKDAAAAYYARIIRDYPLSGLSADAKKKLTAIGKGIPQPDPQALAWMQKERSADRGRASILRKTTGILRPGPDVRSAARYGAPNLEPGSEASGVDILTPGGQIRLGGTATGAVTTPLVEVVTPGVNAASTTGTPTDGTSDSSGQPPAPNPSTGAPDTSTPIHTQTGDGNPTPATDGTAAQPATLASSAGGESAAAGRTDAAGSGTPPNCSNTTASNPSADGKTDTSQANCSNGKAKESSSKKKKKKIILW